MFIHDIFALRMQKARRRGRIQGHVNQQQRKKGRPDAEKVICFHSGESECSQE
jgi:hypothetical protein